MTEFIQIRLDDMIEQVGEDRARDILSSFVCYKNKDVENFLREKAIVFSQRKFAKTYLVYWLSDDKKEKELVGYYTVAQKVVRIAKESLSKTRAKKFRYYGEYDDRTKEFIVPAPLIAQLGKNFKNGNDCLIYGDELLQMAIEKVKDVQREVGGKFTYLECEEKEKLVKFYEKNGFTVFGKRKLDKDETDVDGEYLLQLLMIL